MSVPRSSFFANYSKIIYGQTLDRTGYSLSVRNLRRGCKLYQKCFFLIVHNSLTPVEQKLSDSLQPFLAQIETHPIFTKIQTMSQLRIFMEHHVFAVWDFMSLLKFLQGVVAPSTWPWIPRPQGNLVRLINEIVLGEECDLLPPAKIDSSPTNFASHFDIYLFAMNEVAANTQPILSFLELLKTKGLAAALASSAIPESSRAFMTETFALLREGIPHKAAAAFAFGRENAIPGMFQSLLSKLGISQSQAPLFHYYLQRHAELDGEEHGPAALRLVTALCNDHSKKLEEALTSAQVALQSRKRLWDALAEAL